MNELIFSAIFLAIASLLGNMIATWLAPYLDKKKTFVTVVFVACTGFGIWLSNYREPLAPKANTNTNTIEIIKPSEVTKPATQLKKCKWNEGVSIEECIKDLSTDKSKTNMARRYAYAHRGFWNFEQNHFADSEKDLTVAISEAPDYSAIDSLLNPELTWFDKMLGLKRDENIKLGATKQQVAIIEHYFRGLSRIELSKYEIAYQDCSVEIPTLLLFNQATTKLKQLQLECIGISLSKLQRHAEANLNLSKAIDMGNSSWQAYFARYESRKNLDDKEGALSDFTVAMRLKESNSPPVWKKLAESY